MRRKVTISLQPDQEQALKRYAAEHYGGNVSAVVAWALGVAGVTNSGSASPEQAT